jgi:hypothetical protein
MDKGEPDTARAVAAGLAAGGAFLAAVWADSKWSSHPFNDLKLVGQMLTTRSPLWQIQGLMSHFGFSAIMGAIYAHVAYSKLPGPGVLRGLLFLQIENSLLYPVAPIIDKIHAGMRRGQLPPLLNWKTFWGQMLRHVAFGAVLGMLYKPKKER